MRPKTIELPAFGIKIRLAPDGKSGTITSDLSNTGGRPDALDGIESLILAHAVAGVDVTADAYVGGVQTAVYAALNVAEDASGVPPGATGDWGTLRRALCEVINGEELDAWMLRPNKAFGDRTPEQVMLDGDVRLLWDMCYRLSSGQPG
jgi:hypothetical protein